MGSNLVSSNILDVNGVITMPESISVPSSGSFENKNKNTGSQMGHTNKKYLKKENQLVAIHRRLGSEDLLAKP